MFVFEKDTWLQTVTDFDELYLQEKEISKGVNTFIYVALDVINDIKVVVKRTDFTVFDTDFNKKIFENEVQIYNKIGKHPNIVEYLKAYKNDKYGYLILEFIDNCDVFRTYFTDDGDIIKLATTKNIWFILRDMISAMQHLHSLQIAHQDIKLENIIFDERSNKYKIFDFEFSGMKLQNDHVGTLHCMSPELVSWILSKERKELTFEDVNKHDIWAIGVMLYELANPGFLPYNLEHGQDGIDKILNGIKHRESAYKGSKYGIVTSYIINFMIERCLDNDTFDRPDIFKLKILYELFTNRN